MTEGGPISLMAGVVASLSDARSAEADLQLRASAPSLGQPVISPMLSRVVRVLVITLATVAALPAQAEDPPFPLKRPQASKPEPVDLLLSHGARREAGDTAKHTPLMYAAIANNLAMYQHLVRAGARLDSRDKEEARRLPI